MKIRNAGFTVIELMITISIIAILTMVAAPSLRDLIRNARMTTLANDLMTDLSIARAEAVKRNVRVTMCTSNTGTDCTNTEWRFGWIIFAEYNNPGSEGTVDINDAAVLVSPRNDFIVKVSPRINGADETPPTMISSQSNPTATGDYVNFRPSGASSPGTAGTTIIFHVCDARRPPVVSTSEAANKGRRITILGTGRAQSTRCACIDGGTRCN